MNTVITINLNGRAYQIEEPGYRALRKYLDEAEAKLAGNPDKSEIMADFEQAIADKCDRRLGATKNVVTTNEIEEVITAMGPVEGTNKNETTGGTTTADTTSEKAGAGTAPKRLYRIYEGEIFKGVCNGIAAYFNIDVTLVRVLFVVLTALTGGIWVVAYIVLMIVMPVALTDDDIARAHGEPPFTAKDFMDRARAEYEKYKEDPEKNKQEWKQSARQWKKDWHEKSRAWRDEWHATRREERDAWRKKHHHPVDGPGAVFGIIVSIALFILFVIALVSLVTHGMVFGHALGIGHPLWVPILFLVAAFYIISFPFRHLHGHHYDHDYGHHHEGGVLLLLFLILFVWTAITLFPPVREVWQSLITYLRTIKT